MSGSLRPPDFKADIADLRRRVDILERRLTPKTAVAATELVFSYAGSLASGSESPPKTLVVAAALGMLAVAFAAGEAGSTDTILEVKRDGTVVATVTVPASTETYDERVGVAFAAGQRISLRVATAGTGAADMTATARFT